VSKKASSAAASRKRCSAASASSKKKTASPGDAPGVVYVAKVAHNDQFGEHDETLGVYADKETCAKVVREHIEKEYGTDLVDEYEVKQKGRNGFVSVYAHGWEGESMEVYMDMHKIQA
jgi:hypothetical protein